jgi:hypothetical protein
MNDVAISFFKKCPVCGCTENAYKHCACFHCAECSFVECEREDEIERGKYGLWTAIRYRYVGWKGMRAWRKLIKRVNDDSI